MQIPLIHMGWCFIGKAGTVI
jgi:hypothetical protein